MRGILNSRKMLFFAGVSSLALSVSAALCPASAANYTAGSDTELRNAIAAANADGDATATITLSGDVAQSVVDLPAPTKPITIDTQGHVLLDLRFVDTNGQTVTLSGIFEGSPGARAIWTRSGTVRSFIINNGSLTGGVGGGSNSAGANLSTTTLVNNGTIRGGAGTAAADGGPGIFAQRGNEIINNGLIEGGSSVAAHGGAGILLGNAGAGALSTLTNSGIIRGGNGATGGGVAVSMGALGGTIVNTGTIEGGDGAKAIIVRPANTLIVNGGTISGGVLGAGYADAVGMYDAASTLTLELRAGSQIRGNVVANAALSDTLRLGGTGSDSFDIASIGAANQYQNFDVFEKTGTGTWLLTGIGTSATNWTVYDGTLLVGDASHAATVLGNIDNRATLGGAGTIVGDVTNSGTVAPVGALTISGNYIGSGGTVAIDAVLSGDASTTDQLMVTGNTSGTSNIRVTNLGGAGALTSEGIKIIDIAGVSAGTFTLAGDYIYNGDQAVVGGAYAYRLYQNGISTPADGDWYLRSVFDPALSTATPLYQPGVAIYEAYPQILQALNRLGSLQQRVGDRYWQTDADPVAKTGPDGVWFRTGGMRGGVAPNFSSSGSTYDYDLWKSEGGVDGELYQNGNGRLIGGLTAHLGTISGDVSSVYGNGTVDTVGYGVGATLTWYGEDGFYADALGQATVFDTNLKSDLVDGNLKDSNNGFGYALSVETGRRFATAGAWTITPQAQLVYSSVNFDDFHDRFGAPISLDRGGSLNGGIGVALDHDESWKQADGKAVNAKFYGSADLYYEFLDGSAVNVADVRFATDNDRLAAGITLGGSYSWNDGRTSVYGEVIARSSLENVGDSYAVGGTAGLRVKW